MAKKASKRKSPTPAAKKKFRAQARKADGIAKRAKLRAKKLRAKAAK